MWGMPQDGVENNTNAFLNREQQVGDLDLTNAVIEIMRTTGVSEEKIWIFTSNPQVSMSMGKAPDVQLFLLKEFWIFQLLVLQQTQGINTMEDRLLVNQFNDPRHWFEYFAKNVMDLVHIHGLPVQNGW